MKNPNLKENIKILAFDTSCDDTSAAVLDGRKVLSNVVSSQVELHKKWGGTVPDIARRAHSENIEPVTREALKRAGLSIKDIDAVAVTYGPGLAIALEIGLQYAQKLAHDNHKKFIPVNHMEGHMLASFALNRMGKGQIPLGKEADYLPMLAVLVSGNHTEIVYVKDFGQYEILGETLDDAAGEAFDKVARMLNIGYPGGPIITTLAKRVKDKAAAADKFGLPIPMQKSGDMNFSFSGLKTACLYKIKTLREEHKKDTEWSYDFCMSFIDKVSKSLEQKLTKALELHPEVKAVVVGGGVINNSFIVRNLGRLTKKYGKHYLYPEMRFRSDNAGMIGMAAYYDATRLGRYLEGDDIMKIDRKPGLVIEDVMKELL